jgi:predicted transcriptional regulator
LSSPYYQPFRSQLKLDILASLLLGEKKLGALREELGSSGSTIIHALSDLEELKLVRQAGKHYSLTPLGVIEAQLLEEASSAVLVLERFRDFWLTHDVAAIPSRLLRRLGALEDSILVQNDSVELNRVHSTFQQILLTSRRVWGLSPIFHPDFVGVFQRLLGEGASVELVLTKGVFERVLSLADEGQFTGYVKDGMLGILVAEGLRVALTVTENSFSMGLFGVDGEYDYTRDLVSNSQEAIGWGEELFQHCLKGAKRIGLDDLGLRGGQAVNPK